MVNRNASNKLGWIVGGLALVGACASAYASPSAVTTPVFATQPDGTQLEITLNGNADHAWYQTPDGYLVTKDTQNRWVYATHSHNGAKSFNDSDEVLATDFVVGKIDPATVGMSPYQRQIHNHHNHDLHKAVGGGNPISSKLGTVPMLVIMGYYDDALSAPNCGSCATTDPDYVQQLFFADGSQQQSVADFFATASKGKFIMSSAQESHGTENDGVVGWLRLGSETPSATSMTTTAYKSNRIAADAINAAMNYVDFTQYDIDDNGLVTANELGITILLGGYEASYGRDAVGKTLADDVSSPRVWGQSRTFVTISSGVSIPQQTVNSKKVRINTSSNGMTYSIMGERHGDHPLTMGIVTHELGHTLLDLPDLYDTQGSSNGVGGWSLMGYGSWGKARQDSYPGATPVMLDAWSRLALGWANEVLVTSGELSYLNAHELDVLKIPTINQDEYFLVENRRHQGYDQGLYYFLYSTSFGGLALWHIDDSVGRQNLNNDNANVNRKRVDLVAALGDDLIDEGISYGQMSNLFHADTVNAINSQTHSNMMLYSGGDSGIDITDISYVDVSMSFTAYYDGETAKLSTNSLDAGLNANLNQASSPSEGGGGAMPLSLLLLLAGLFLRRAARVLNFKSF